MPKRTNLVDLSVEEVSLVDRPANPGARVLLMKRDGESSIAKEVMDRLPKWLQKVLKLHPESADEILKEEEAMTIEELTKQMETLKKSNELSEAVRKVSRDISKSKDEAELKAMEADLSKLEFPADKASLKAELLEQVAEKRASFSKAGEEATVAEFRKSLPAPMHPAFDSMNPEDKKKFMESYGKKGSDDPMAKALVDLNKSNADMAAKLKKMENESEVKKLMDGDLKDLAGVTKVEDLATAVLTLKSHDSDATEVLVKQIKALVAQVKEGGLLKTLGKDGTVTKGGAYAKLEGLAKAYLTEHASEKLTLAEAFVKVSEANKELATQANAELGV